MRQDATLPGLIHARDFGYLKQEDDWYILAADPQRSVSVPWCACASQWSPAPSSPPSI